MSGCRWVSSTEPRVLPGRHRETCENEACAGCQPCGEPHCRECGVAHVSGVEACVGCLESARSTLDDIRRLTEALPEEAELRGVDGEAFNLLGPAADPEARGHLEASVKAGRVPPEYLEVADNERHPLFVAATWASVYREAFDHDEPSGRVELADELGYLGRNLTYAAGFEHVPWEEFARDLRTCVAHLEAVLHDGEQIDRSRVTCVNERCKRRPMLERKFGWGEEGDRWACPSCGKVYEPGEYQKAHARQLAHKGAEKYLPLRDAVSTLVAQGRPERTVRKWLTPPDPEVDDLESDDAIVGGYCEIGSRRVWVWWPDLWRLHLTTKTRQRAAA